jgi:copper chaperone NosL
MKTLTALSIIMLGLLAACSRAPQPIAYGKDACTHCKMTIMDKRFASEIVTAKGKIFKFDAAECMAGFLKENPEIVSNEKSTFLVDDFSHPGQFVDAKKSWYLTDNSLSSPMGANLAAFSSEDSAKAMAKDSSAKIFPWTTLLKSK